MYMRIQCVLKNCYVQAQELKLKGNDLFKQGKLDEAAKYYEDAIQLSVGDGEKDSVVAVYHQNLAAVYDVLVSMARAELCNGDCIWWICFVCVQ